MIVRRLAQVRHLITQPAHAALARRIMEHWRPLDEAERRTSILLAVAEHDNGWQEADAAPTVDAASGEIHDFVNAPVAVRQGVWPRGIARLSHDPWAAALVAQHAITVYDRYRSDAAWQEFFATMAAMRDERVAAAHLTQEELLRDYQFVRIGDLISLIFCNEWRDELSFGDWQFRGEADRVLVHPDPFAGRAVEISVPAQELPARAYTSDEDLQRALADAPTITLRGVVTGAAEW